MTELRETLYSSVLAPQQSATIVGQIVSRARGRNEREGITGLLVFDGMRFCQHFEGPAEKMAALMQRIERDPRHTDIQILYTGTPAQRRYLGFEMGLAQVEDADELAALADMVGADALARFIALRPRLDIMR